MLVAFQCTPAEGVDPVRLPDLPVGDLDRIAKEAGVNSWTTLYYGPLADGAAAEALFRHCCDVRGVTPPEPITPAVLLDAFDRIDEDLPKASAKDSPPPEGDQATT